MAYTSKGVMTTAIKNEEKKIEEQEREIWRVCIQLIEVYKKKTYIYKISWNNNTVEHKKFSKNGIKIAL